MIAPLMTRTATLRVAFTLVEWLVVLAIMALLVGLILSAVQSVRAAASRATCQSHLRQLAIASHNYMAIHSHFPEGVHYPVTPIRFPPYNKPSGLPWDVLLLPFIEQAELGAMIDKKYLELGTGSYAGMYPLGNGEFPVFRCPSDPQVHGRNETSEWGLLNYLGVAGEAVHLNDGLFHMDYCVSALSVTDGTSNTLLIGERATSSPWFPYEPDFTSWILPVNIDFAQDQPYCPQRGLFQAGVYNDPCDSSHFWSLHPGGSNFAFADGSVKFLKYSAADILPALATRAGGETVGLE